MPHGLEVFIGWFWELSTERQLGLGGQGPIPMSAVRRLCRDLSLDRDVVTLAKSVISSIDHAYLEWVRDNAPKASAAPPPPDSSEGGWPKKRRR